MKIAYKALAFVVLLLTLTVSQAFAAKAKTKSKGAKKKHLLFTVLVQGKYTNQKTIVYREGKDWICNTEIKKLFFAGDKKFDMQHFAAAMAEKSKFGPNIECRDSMTMIDHVKNKTRKHICVENEKAKDFLNHLTRYCGR